MQATAQELEKQRASALELLKGGTDMRAKTLRGQIEAIDPADATRREKDRLAALCRKVGKFHAGALNKTFERQPDLSRQQNHRGSRGRAG